MFAHLRGSEPFTKHDAIREGYATADDWSDQMKALWHAKKLRGAGKTDRGMPLYRMA